MLAFPEREREGEGGRVKKRGKPRGMERESLFILKDPIRCSRIYNAATCVNGWVQWIGYCLSLALDARCVANVLLMCC
jgi:hypothetical protein